MRFKVKPKPKLWDRKYVVKFAFFPKRIDDTIVWLESYVCVYRYEYDYYWCYYYWEKENLKLIN